MEGSGRVLIESSIPHLPGETEENHKYLRIAGLRA
jgi:hypothetical protein